MSDTENNEAPSLIIPTEHQSAPKEHWIVDEMRKAAAEIDKGTFRPELADDDYFYSGPEQLVAMHPRVKEAIARLEREIPEASNSQEFIEKWQMLHELNEEASKPDRWDGQGRWMGQDNEQMRHGELLTPVDFMKRLTAVIGETRVQLNRFAVQHRVALLVDDPDAERKRLMAIGSKAIDFDYSARQLQKANAKDFKTNLKKLEAAFQKHQDATYIPPDYLKDKVQVGTLQWPLGTEWMVMRFNEYGVPTTAKYLGWRTALMSMIFLGIISEDEAHKAFPVKPNEASIWYRAQLFYFRNYGKANA